MRSWLFVLLLSCAGLKGQEKLAPYVPTPPVVGQRMLELAELRAGEKMFDLGSGDGRLVILAAQKFGAEAVGVEIDSDLVAQSRALIAKAKIGARAKIIEGDLLQQDYRSADVLTIYLYPAAMKKVRPLLEEQLRKGTRVVTHDFPMEGWSAAATETLEDDGTGRSRMIFVYRR